MEADLENLSDRGNGTSASEPRRAQVRGRMVALSDMGFFFLMPYLSSKAKCSLRSNLENWTVQSEVTNNLYFVSRTYMLMTVSLWGELRAV